MVLNIELRFKKNWKIWIRLVLLLFAELSFHIMEFYYIHLLYTFNQNTLLVIFCRSQVV